MLRHLLARLWAVPAGMAVAFLVVTREDGVVPARTTVPLLALPAVAGAVLLAVAMAVVAVAMAEAAVAVAASAEAAAVAMVPVAMARVSCNCIML